MRNNIYKYLFLLLLCLPTGLLAQNRYWVNGSGEWNNSNHWSETSGGKGGASVPSLKNAVIFDSNSSNNSFVVDIMKSAGAYSVDVKSGADLSLNSNSDINFAYKESIDRVFRNQFIGNLIDLSNVQSESRSRSSRAYSLNVVSVKPVSCAGAMDGEIEFEAIGSGVTKFQFAWFNTDYFTSGQIVTTSTSAKFTGMFPGSIILFIKDADGAAPYPLLVQSFAVVGSPAALELSKDDIVSVNPSCSGSANGSLVATAKGGNLPYTYILDPGNVSNSTGTFNNLADGTYSVRVDDANGCGPVTVNNISIKEPNPIAITNVDLKHVDCYNVANGQITVTATGGNDLEYSIDGVTFKNIGESFSGLATASYTITVRDKIDNSCKLVDGPYLISQPADIVFSETLSDYNGFNISCPGNNDGSINVTGTGGENNNLEYSIGAAFKNVGSSFGSLAAGNYTITIRDKDNPTCTKTKDITLTEPTIISIASTVANVKCFGGSDGKIDVVSSQGVAPYIVTLTKLPAAVVATKMGASVSFDNLTLGSYKIDVVDANGCSQSKNVTVTQPNEIVVSEIIKNLTCFNSNNGSIEVVVNDGTPNYVLELKYQANGTTQTKTGVTAGAASSFENLVAGNYVLTVDDANSCVKTENYIVTEPAIITPTINVKSVTCFSGSNGEILVSVSGGTPPYKVVVDNIAASISKTEVEMALNEARSFTNLVAGSYVITISDFNGCSTIETKDISQPTEISIDFTPSHVTCFGGNDGSVSVKVTNGTPNYTVELFNTDDILINTVLNVTSISPAVFNTLIAGDYYIKVTDANNCEKLTSNFSITQPTEIVVNNFVLQNLTCSGSGNGKISLNISGGNAPYKVDISKGAFNQSKSNIAADVEFDNLESGLFNVLITDAVGCQISKSYTLTEPNSFTVDRVITDASCFQGDNGEIEITVTGGTAPYVLELTGGAITKTESGVAENAKTTFTNLTAQSYSVKILDVNNCEIVVNYTVNQPAEIALTGLNTIKPLCFSNADGKIVFNIIGGTPLYNVFLLKEDGSQYAQLTSVNQAELLEFSAVSAGNYTIKVVDAKLCEKEFPVVVDQPAPIVIKLNSVDNVSCNAGNNGRIAFEVSGGTPLYSVDLLNSVGTTILTRNNFAEATEDIFVDLVADTYKIKVVDDNGCQKEYTDIVITQPQPIVLVPTVNNLSCFESSNGFIQFSISGGTAVYTVQLFDMASAEVAKLENVLENESKSFDNLSIGTYSIKVTDIATCTNLTENITLTQPEKLISTAVVQKNASCFGDANGQILATVVSGGVAPFQVSIDGGANFNFTDGLIDNIAAGDYQVIIKDANGCMSETVSLTVTQPEKLIAIFDVTNVICKNDNSGTITVNPTGGTAPYEYSIDYKPFVINNFFDGLQANDYIIAVKDANGCIFAQTVVVTEPLNGLKIRTVNSKNIFSCNGNLEGEIIFTATSEFAITYYIDGPVSLNNTTGIFQNLPAGDYDIYVTDESGCTVMHTKQIAITQPSELVFDYVNVTNFLPTSCAGDKQGKIFVKASGGVGPYQFSIDGVNYTTSREFNNLDGGKYEVYVKDANGCITMQEVTITAPLPIVITSVVAQDPNCFNTTDGKIVVVAEGGTGNLNYKINGGAAQDNGTFDNLAAGNYTVTITDENNCSLDSDLVVLSSPDQIIIEAQVKKYPKGETTADGEMFVKVTGGVNSFIVSLDKTDAPALVIPAPANTSEFLFTGLLAGEYTVHVSDANGCSDITLDFTLEPFKITLSADDVKCFGESNGKISVLVEGGKAPYKYEYFILPVGDPINIAHNNITETTDFLDKLPAGDYRVSVTDVDGFVLIQEVAITAPLPIVITSVVAQDPNCFNTTDGKIVVVAEGGTGNLNYKINGGAAQDNGTFDNLAAGNYTVTVTDENNCSLDSDLVVLSSPDQIIIEAQVKKYPKGETTADGEMFVKVTGGVNSFIVSLDKTDAPALVIPAPANTSEFLFTGLLAGEYTVHVSDANGCSDITLDFTLEPFKITLSADDVKCFGESNGKISVLVEGGKAPFNYSYFIKPDGKPINTLHNNYPDHNDSLDNLPAGDYIVTVTESNGDVVTKEITVGQPAEITSTENVINNNCFGESNGSVKITIAGGTAPYQVTWSSASLAADVTQDNIADITKIDKLLAGEYTASVVDAAGCNATFKYEVTQPTKVVAFAEVVSPLTDELASNGEIKTTATGGSGNYLFSLKKVDDVPATIISGNAVFSTEYIFQNLLGKDYQAFAIDENGCASDPTNIILTTFKVEGTANQPCFGSDNGSISLTITNGVEPFKIEWTNSAAETSHADDVTNRNFIINNLPADIYDITVTDVNGTVFVLKVNVVSLLDITISETVTHILCNGKSDGKISFSANGGKAPYTIIVNNGATEIFNEVGVAANEDKLIENIPAGDYSFTITDDSGCSANKVVTVNQSDALTIVTSDIVNPTSETSTDGSVKITIAGGTPNFDIVIYSISDDGTESLVSQFDGVSNRELNVSNLTVGNYKITVADASGCDVVSTKFSLVSFLVQGVVTQPCFGSDNGSIALTITNGVEPFNIQWTNTAGVTSQADGVTIRNFNINNLPADIYDITVTDVNGTVFVLKVDVVSLLDITISETVTHVLCNGKSDGIISFSANGGNEPYTIIVNNGATEIFNEVGVAANEDKLIENIPAGDYSFAITDASGCSANKVITVNQSDALTVVASDIVNPSSETSTDGSVKITVAGGKPKYDIAIYSISDDGTETFVNQFEGVSLTEVSFSNLTIGHYKVTVADVSGCDVAVTEFTLSSFKFIPTAYPVLPCPDMLGKIELNIVGGIAPFNVVVKLGDKEIANTIVDITGTTSFDKLSEGGYSISIVDAKGNNPENNLAIVNVEKLSYSVPTEINAPDCNYKAPIKGSILVRTDKDIVNNYPGNTNLNITYSWKHINDGSFPNPIDKLESGIYTLVINSDLFSCPFEYNIPLEASTKISVDGGSDQTICKGSNLDISFTTNVSGNKSTDGRIEFFFGESQVGESKDFKYDNLGAFGSLFSPVPENEGEYRIVVYSNGCHYLDTVKVDFHPSMNFELLYNINSDDDIDSDVPYDNVIIGDSYDFGLNKIVRYTSGNPTFKWDEINTKEFYTFTFNSDDFNYKNPIIHFINPVENKDVIIYSTAISEMGCEEKAEFRIHFIDSTPPNAISPNDDGIHDSWKIPNAEKYKDIEVIILNRWGIKVFYTKHYSNSGDYGDCFKGLSSGGNKLPAGTYYFVIDYNRDGSSPVKGSITIIR